ncbi:hypothetical protein C173_21391 [Paenibacillus sp. FSL R7-277]|uniref:hypothetical protein n=1 Tax=Paenibacillus sp. FSL R7-277 TaxID=1227352 RepID=UPI0003E28774|nr:hypothetical protein [Paenibacillus sp. FSL R7-277]ETT64402.1 hypothetical protein C173_21391 [Paenibacillus sp. FSL R7-277]
MSAFAEFDRERQEIDNLTGLGYTVAGIYEDLDGARVTFIRREPAGGPVELLLLTADARKHVTTLLVGRTRPVESIEAQA